MIELKDNPEVIKTYKLNFKLEGKPEPYARVRAGRTHFYNPKGNIKKSHESHFLSQLKETEHYKEIMKLISEKDNIYYLSLDMIFYVSPPKSDSNKKREAKLKNIILPAIAPDLDNYMKFTLDALHNVIYDNDKRVLDISAKKRYSDDPRTEIEANIYIIKIK